jgi:PBSX family phage terminase large subunit
MILTDKQKEFIRNATHRYNIKIGARRCGKTYLDILYMIPNRIIERKGKDGLNVIFGVSNGTIERNVLQPLREIYGKSLVGFINSQNIATLFGEETYCLGTEKKNQISKIQGTSIKYAYGDEIAKWNKEVFIMIQGSLDKTYSCLDGALNPENKNHWFKKEFIDEVAIKGLDVYLQYYTIFDNPFLSKDFVNNLCKEYAGTVYYNRLILGQWCDAEGLIFRQIADNKDRYITTIQNSGFISIGIDWGGNKSYHSITATRIRRDYSNIQTLRSERLKATGTDTKVLFKWLIGVIKDIIAEHGMVGAIYCDSAEQVLNNSLRSELAVNGLHISLYDSVKTPIKDRIEAITRLLNTDRATFIKDKTNTIVEALQTALFDDKAIEDRWIDDGQTSDIDSLDSYAYSWTKWQNELMRYKGVNNEQ